MKVGPCGDGSGRSKNVTTFRPGETITVVWKETVEHPGHFRIAFANDEKSFTDPKSFTDVSGGPGVLVDNIADRVTQANDNTYTQEVTLPAEECETCTLQLIQMMTDKPPFGSGGGDDIYYQCADIVLHDDSVNPGAGGVAGEAARNDSAPSNKTSEGDGTTAGGGGTTAGGGGGPASPAEKESGCVTSSYGAPRGSVVILWTLALATATWWQKRRRSTR